MSALFLIFGELVIGIGLFLFVMVVTHVLIDFFLAMWGIINNGP